MSPLRIFIISLVTSLAPEPEPSFDVGGHDTCDRGYEKPLQKRGESTRVTLWSEETSYVDWLQRPVLHRYDINFMVEINIH